MRSSNREKAHQRWGLMVAIVVGVSTSSSAETWIVDPSGGGDAITIQEAVNLASSGDEILVHPGIYREQVTASISLTIRGDETTVNPTVIDAEGVRPYCILVNSFSASTVLRALTLTGVHSDGTPPCGESALRIYGALDMENCTVIENVAEIAPLFTGGPAQIRNCVFKDNVGTGWCEGGIDPDFASGAIHCLASIIADGCIFESNVGWSVGAVSSDEVTLRNCRILDNEGIGVVRAVYEATLEKNIISGNFGRLLYGGDLIATFRGNTVVNNQVTVGSGILNILPGSVLEENVFAFNNVGLGVPNGGQGITITCNDAWGNEVDYFGFDPLPGLNISADPMFCGVNVENFFVDTQSPLLPKNNSCHVLIGALGQGCGTVSVESKSWGQIKGLYR